MQIFGRVQDLRTPRYQSAQNNPWQNSVRVFGDNTDNKYKIKTYLEKNN
jgi:hypothetical protein